MVVIPLLIFTVKSPVPLGVMLKFPLITIAPPDMVYIRFVESTGLIVTLFTVAAALNNVTAASGFISRVEDAAFKIEATPFVNNVPLVAPRVMVEPLKFKIALAALTETIFPVVTE